MVELLVSIAIIGLLSAIVVGSLGDARAKGRDSQRISDIQEVRLGLELYYDINKNYPTSIPALLPDGFISSEPKDPSSGLSYSYAALGSGSACSSYHLGATLETTHSALGDDRDASSAVVCTGSVGDFDGIDPIFDIKP